MEGKGREGVGKRYHDFPGYHSHPAPAIRTYMARCTSQYILIHHAAVGHSCTPTLAWRPGQRNRVRRALGPLLPRPATTDREARRVCSMSAEPGARSVECCKKLFSSSERPGHPLLEHWSAPIWVVQRDALGRARGWATPRPASEPVSQ